MKKETEIQWALRMLRSNYNDSRKALSINLLTKTAQHNVDKYESLVELNDAIKDGMVKLVLTPEGLRRNAKRIKRALT